MRTHRDVLICEHRRLFAEPLAFVLEARGHHEVEVEVVQDLAGAVGALAARPTAVAIVDRYLGPTDMLDHLPSLANRFATTQFVILDPDGQPAARRRAMDNGAAAWFTMTSKLETMVEAVSGLLNGRRPESVEKASAKKGSEFTHLTPRELEVLQCLVYGLDGRAMARELGISYTTVRTHIQRVLWKLGVHSRVEAVAYALSHNLVPLSDAKMWRSSDSGGPPATSTSG